MPDDRFNRWFQELLATCTRSNQRAVARHLESLRILRACDTKLRGVFEWSQQDYRVGLATLSSLPEPTKFRVTPAVANP